MQKARTFQRLAFVLMIVVAAVFVAPTAMAAPSAEVIVLPGATSAEGIAVGHGSTFYAGDLFGGDIFRGDLQRGTAELFIDAPEGRQAVGMTYDDATGLLYVAGGFTGQAYVYDTSDGSTVAWYQFGDPNASLINDVTLTGAGAYFTDTFAGLIYFVPVVHGVPGAFTTITVSGPAGEVTGPFNLNGIVATPDGRTLIVAHTANASLYTVDPLTGVSALIEGVNVPNVDGIVLEGRKLWAVQNFSNQISAIRLSADLSSGVVENVITSDNFEVPSTAARHGNKLAVAQAKFDTGFPPTADQYEIVIVPG